MIRPSILAALLLIIPAVAFAQDVPPVRHTLSVGVHPSITGMPAGEIRDLLTSLSNEVSRSNDGDHVRCPVEFQQGSVARISDRYPAEVYSLRDIQRYRDIGFDVVIVSAINYCLPGRAADGCTVPGRLPILVTRNYAESSVISGRLWGHEFGHYRNLPDEPYIETRLMFSQLSRARDLTVADCAAVSSVQHVQGVSEPSHPGETNAAITDPTVLFRWSGAHGFPFDVAARIDWSPERWSRELERRSSVEFRREWRNSLYIAGIAAPPDIANKFVQTLLSTQLPDISGGASGTRRATINALPMAVGLALARDPRNERSRALLRELLDPSLTRRTPLIFGSNGGDEARVLSDAESLTRQAIYSLGYAQDLAEIERIGNLIRANRLRLLADDERALEILQSASELATRVRLLGLINVLMGRAPSPA